MISCIMPTADRREFVPYAIEYFQQQTYEDRELIVVDDGHDSCRDLVPEDVRIQYLRVPRSTIGAKRNIAIEQARGDIIVHWDDDDWYAPTRIEQQVADLENTDLTGYSSVYFYWIRQQQLWLYNYSQLYYSKPYVIGGSFCYRRSVWKQHPFENLNYAEDNRFLRHVETVRSISGCEQYVVMRHRRNTDRRDIPEESHLWHRISPHVLWDIMGQDAKRYSISNEEVQMEQINPKATYRVKLGSPLSWHRTGQPTPKAGDIIEIPGEYLQQIQKKRSTDKILGVTEPGKPFEEIPGTRTVKPKPREEPKVEQPINDITES